MLFRSYAVAVCACVCLILGTHASAQIQVQSPGSSSSVPVYLEANITSTCGGKSVIALSYSVDSSPFYTLNTSDQINAYDYSILPGSHTIRYKAWTGGGSPCQETDVQTTVGNNINPTVATKLDDASNSDWQWVDDTGIKDGSASGTTELSSTESIDGQSREFQMTYSDGGGMRGSIDFGNSSTATYFVYDAYVYLADPSSVQNVEMDTNQASTTGDDIWIFGLQCAFDVGYWEYTVNSGGDTWKPTSVPCSRWSGSTWHHAQLAVHKDSSGNVHYDTITFDGITTAVNLTEDSYFSVSPWTPNVLVLNFQLDGEGSSGSITAYVDGLQELYW